jgi:hypothetical protein
MRYAEIPRWLRPWNPCGPETNKVVSMAIPARDLGQMCATETQSHYALARLVVRAEISIRLSEIMGLKWSDLGT